LKKKLKTFIQKVPNIPFLDRYSSGLGTIFMMHRVETIDKNGLSNVEDLKLSPKYLEKVIYTLRQMHYDFISLGEVEERLDMKSKRKFVVFTLDDGYKDNYTTAYPIFKKYNIPFTVYVTSSFLNRTASLWWYSISELILRENKIITAENETIRTNSISEKEKAFCLLKKKILTFNINNIEREICNYLPLYSFNFKQRCEELCMNWSELKKMAEDPLVTIGGHTINHPALNKLSKEDVLKEVMGNKVELEEKLMIKIDVFSYPFGGEDTVGIREFEVLDKLNFKNSTTTRTGNIFPIHKEYLSSLPRIALTENYELRKKMFMNPIIINKGKRINLK
jgi:peptidoglycan/xylan/chitin deacetylase (PgdA/CDA1 family)